MFRGDEHGGGRFLGGSNAPKGFLVFAPAFNFLSSLQSPIKATTMKKLIVVIAILSVFTAPLLAQEKGTPPPPPNTYWRITSGKGAGVTLRGFGPLIFDSSWEANGHIGTGPECECQHYHNILFGQEDPDPNGCGWGCAEKMPFNASDAFYDLADQINVIGMTSPDLADKLDMILDDMDRAAFNGCYTVVEALADAFEDEIYAYFGLFGSSPAFDPLFAALTDYVNLAEHSLSMSLGYLNIPEMKPNTVKFLHRIGSGNLSQLLDVGPKVTAKIGSMVSLEAYGADVELYKIQYKWKGFDVGFNPSGSYVSYVDNHITAMSQNATSVRVTVWGMLPDQKQVKDTTVINFTRFNF
jgi:hypothetical protein